MNLNTPSGTQQSNKRVRFDPTADITPDTSTSAASAARMKVPKARASATITSHTATLLPQLSTILQTLGDKHLDLLHRQYNKSTQLLRMEPDDTIIPRSARLKFELSVPKCIEELPDFIQLRDECATELEQMKLSLRKRVIAALAIEVKFYAAELKEQLITALYTATAAILISNGNANINCHRAVAHLVSVHHIELLKHVKMTIEDFRVEYTRIHSLATYPSLIVAPTTPNANLNNGASRYFTQQPTQQEIIPAIIEDIPQLDLIHRTIQCIFTSPFDNYLDQHRVNTIELQLKKLVEDELTASATADAQMDVEGEDSASRTLLNELIQKESKKNTSSLVAEIQQLKQQVSSLKDPRGRKPRGASQKRNAPSSTTTKPTKATKPTKQLNKKRNGKADASVPASSKKSTKTSSSPKKKNTRKKKQTSKTGRRK